MSSSSPQPNGSPSPLHNIDVQGSGDKFRSFLLIFIILAGGIALIVYLFGGNVLEYMLDHSEESYIGLGAAILATLIGMGIVSAILKMLFRVVSLTALFKETTDNNKALKPVFRVAFSLFMLYLGFLIFLQVTAYMSENDIFDQIETYSEGFEFDVVTEEGDKTVKFEDGKLTIEDVPAPINIPMAN